MIKRAIAVVGMSLAMVVGANAYAYTVGVVDVQKILGSDKGISKMQATLGAKFASDRSKLEGMAKQLQADSVNYQKNKAVMSKADADKKEAALKEEATKVQAAQMQYQQKIMQAQQDAMRQFVDTIKGAASSVAQKQNLDAVFIDNSVLFAKDSKDITSDVLSKM